MSRISRGLRAADGANTSPGRAAPETIPARPRGQFARGDRIAHVRLVDVLSRNPFGVVWIAESVETKGGRPPARVTAKFVRDDAVAASPALAAAPRIDEWKIAARVVHPNVARVLDGGVAQGYRYVLREWVDGRTLNELVTRAEAKGVVVPVGVVVRIVMDAAEGVHAAHVAGIVHRDVKPQNMVVGRDGVTKVIDFGVAKDLMAVTATPACQVITGTMAFMAPEQAKGYHVDRRADVWALGAVLQVGLGGEAPYGRETDVATLCAVVNGEDPAPVPESAPERIRELILRATAYQAGRRYDTAMELVEALARAARDSSIRATHADVAAFLRTIEDDPRESAITGGHGDSIFGRLRRFGQPWEIVGVVICVVVILASALVAIYDSLLRG